MANFIGAAFRTIWFSIKDNQQFASQISSKFMERDLSQSQIGITIFDMLLKNLMINIDIFSFYEFRSICNGYKESVLPVIWSSTHKLIVTCLDFMFKGNSDKQILKMLDNCLEVLCDVVYFPFAITFYQFKNDVSYEDTSTTIFPDYFYEALSNTEYLKSLAKAAMLPSCPYGTALSIVKILSKLASCRQSLFKKTSNVNNAEAFFGDDMSNEARGQAPEPDLGQEMARRYRITFYEISIISINLLQRFEEEAIINEILDMIQRTFVTFSIT